METRPKAFALVSAASALSREAGSDEEQSVLDLTLQRLAPDRAATAASLEHAGKQVTESAVRLNQRRLVVDEKMLDWTKLL
jgi:exonuclease SbcC